MAHFAELDRDGKVMRVIVVADAVITVDGVESEEVGVAFCRSLFGAGTNWKQTSYTASKRVFYAGIGAKYDTDFDAFIPSGYTKDAAGRKIVPPALKSPDGRTVERKAIDVPIADAEAVGSIKK